MNRQRWVVVRGMEVVKTLPLGIVLFTSLRNLIRALGSYNFLEPIALRAPGVSTIPLRRCLNYRLHTRVIS